MQEKKPPLTIRLSRAARAYLGWTIADLARRAGVDPNTIERWENNRTRPRETTREALRKAFEDAGIVFTNHGEPGLKHRRSSNEELDID